MNIQRGENQDILRNVESLIFHLDKGVKIKIEHSSDNGLIITKVEGGNPALSIVPRMANQIKVL